jgi:hypothetical protein
MTYRTLGRVIKEVVGGKSQPSGYTNLDTSVKDVMYGPKKKVKDDNLNVEPAEDAAAIQKDLDNYNQNIHLVRRASMERKSKIYE